MSRISLVAALLALAACAVPEVDPSREPRDPAADGPWQVGVTTVIVSDPTEPGTTYPVEIWYPARVAPGAAHDQQLGITGRSVRDAPADRRGAPFAVIAFSHGSGGVR